MSRFQILVPGMLLLLLAGLAPTCAVQRAHLVYGVEIVEEGQTWDEASLNAVLTALELLPPHVVRSLGNPDYGPLRILANPEAATLSGTRPYASGANFYFNNDGQNQVILMPYQGTLTVLHELGHAYQMRGMPAGRYAWVYLDPEMRDFMAATGWRLLSSEEEIQNSWDGTDLLFRYEGPAVWQFLSRQEPVEDYANSFALFFYDPATLKRVSPDRYEWFLRHVATDSR